MLLSGYIFIRGCRLALLTVVSLFVIDLAGAEPDEVAATMPEHYLPGLKSILDTALQQAPQIVARQIDIAINEAKTYGPDSLLWPTLSGGGGYQMNTTAVASNQNSQTRDQGLVYNFSINQHLFQWGAIQHQREQARISVLISQNNLGEARRVLAVSLRRDYLSLITQKIGVRNTRYYLDLAISDLEYTQDRRANGLASEGEVSSSRLTVDDRKLQWEMATAQFESARRTFAHIAGLSELPDDAVPTEIPAPSYAEPMAKTLLAGVLHDGGRSTFQAKITELEIENADLGFRIARVRLLPQFNASAGYSQQNTTTVANGTAQQTGTLQQSIGLGMSWYIFDGFATRGAKLEALAGKRSAERKLQTLTQAVLDQVQSLERQVALEAQAMVYSERRRGIAEGGVKVVQDELALGTLPKNAVALAKLELSASEYSTALARVSFLADWSAFVSLAGADPVINNHPVINNLPSRHVREKK